MEASVPSVVPFLVTEGTFSLLFGCILNEVDFCARECVTTEGARRRKTPFDTLVEPVLEAYTVYAMPTMLDSGHFPVEGIHAADTIVDALDV